MTTSSQISSFPTPRNLSHDLSQPVNNNFNRKGSTRQAFLQHIFTLDIKIKEAPHEFYENLSNGGKRLLDYFLMASTRCRHLYFTQSHIAKKVDLCDRHVRRLLSELEERGVLYTRYRHNTSKEYRVHWFFHDSRTIRIIRNISNGAKFIALAFLLPFSRIDKNELFTPEKQKCPTKTLKDSLYKSLINGNSHFSRLARAWKQPRMDTASETRESRLIAQHNTDTMRSPFSKTLNRIGLLLDLTNAGKVDFHRYPEEALLHAEKLWGRNAQRVGDKVRWFHGVCHKYCKEKQLVISHHLSSKLREHLGIDESDGKVKLPPKPCPEQMKAWDEWCKTLRLEKENGVEIRPICDDNMRRSEQYQSLDGNVGSYKPSAAFPQKEVSEIRSSEQQYYNPTSGTYSLRDPQATISSRVRRSTGPIATEEEKRAIIDAWLKEMDAMGFKDTEEKKWVPAPNPTVQGGGERPSTTQLATRVKNLMDDLR